MVYRGKPSAGCENCRKAKKRCGLEQPSCLRCVKLKKTCSGYRDTTSLQIQDETNAVKEKAQRQQNKTQWQPETKTDTATGLPSPESTDSNSSTPSDTTIELDLEDESSLLVPSETTYGAVDMSVASIIQQLTPKPDDVVTSYFFNRFTSNNHWSFLRGFSDATVDRCLELAIKACGMAALDNIRDIPRGRDYARSMYAEALGLLNDHLRDSKRCKRDTSLIAVSMLGYYENLTCEGRQSIQSWKAHIKGATQLLKLRGKGQFKTPVGRIMFREIRAQVMISCLWDDVAPPDFLLEYQSALDEHSEEDDIGIPVDKLMALTSDFAALRAKMRTREIPDNLAAEKAANLDRRFLQWQIDTWAYDERWRYHEMDVPDSKHVWDGKVHAFKCHPAPTVWNTWRNMRIMLCRTQEWLLQRFQFSDSEREEQVQYFRKTRRQLTDDICATIPVQLGHASPAYSSQCVLITAYGSIWPLFFAGTCALERVGESSWTFDENGKPHLSTSSAAAAQVMWILDRLDYISETVGLKWADGVMATLRGDFHIYDNIYDEPVEPGLKRTIPSITPKNLPWVKEVEKAGRGPRFLIEKPSPLSDALAEDSAKRKKERGPIWLGTSVQVERDENFKISKTRPLGVTGDLPP